MGGKGKSGGNYYNQPPNTSGLSTLEEAERTLAATKPVDMSGYQQNINVKKAAADATAKTEDTSTPDNSLPTESTSGTSTTGDVAAKAVLTPPGFWADYGTQAKAPDPNTQQRKCRGAPMGGKSGPSNNQAVMLQMQQAQEAKNKENLRQARLNQGKGAIDSIFGTENFGDPFYDKYRKAELDYTMPQLVEPVHRRQAHGRESDLARAGLLRSGAAGWVQGKLTEQKGVNEAGCAPRPIPIRPRCGKSIAAQQQQAYNQLYATEDPTVAANTAANSAANAQLQQPNVDRARRPCSSRSRSAWLGDHVRCWGNTKPTGRSRPPPAAGRGPQHQTG